ncbi:MAG: arsenite S-adenosylmethyltransferase [Chitinophagales bacterium]|nr:MAG: arsenite S-adenosylmethyltransferase [Chitinophagales bacterium]
MQIENELKKMVKEKYSSIASQSREQNAASCCGATCGCSDVTHIMADSYKNMAGYVPDADLGLGCGLPTRFAMIKKGDTVVDLGSGAGNDCFVARAETGESGRVIGIDMTEAMIERARQNAEKLAYQNVEFILGEIENIPLPSSLADVVISNCVLNLVPDKRRAFAEIFRILKLGGHFSISDVVRIGNLPGKIMEASEMYAGCIAGALQKSDYLAIIQETGFINLTIQQEKVISIPDSILMNYLNTAELHDYKNSGAGIFSITVYAEKPLV